eukprot:TRINITY_DN243_c0_g2_i1.p1 TRINITY_DN243_c0_g2~~TRINITY_DN243_c0_g2_i1.p1  ORF type:complete len:244 (-),score=59.57 TRINITY_DN243_c0_g2_i1:18-749(-)
MAELTVGILGASGVLGLELIKEGLKNDKYKIKALVRNPTKMRELLNKENIKEGGKLEVKQVDILNEDWEKNLVPELEGVSVVMSALGSPAFEVSDLTPSAMSNVCKALKHIFNKGGVASPKILYCSSWGSGANFEQHDGFLYKLFVNWVIYQPLQTHFKAEKVLASFQSSEFPELSWISIRPPGLLNGPQTETEIFAAPDLFSIPDKPHRISRADVARFFFQQLERGDPNLWNHPVAITLNSQ